MPGLAFLGNRGQIHAAAELGEAIPISTPEQWRALRSKHCVESTALPYRNTYGFVITNLHIFEQPISYSHRRGAIGVVLYRS